MKTCYFIYVVGVLFSCNVFAVGGDYKFGPLVQQSCSVNDKRLQKKLRLEMDRFFETAYYDRTVYYLESGLKPMAADLENSFNQCSFNSKEMFKRHGSANCVGMAQYYQEVLS